MQKIMVVSGGLDPLHKGHIEYIKMAREFIGPEGFLIAIVNRDSFLLQKKGYKLLDENTRQYIVQNLKDVDLATIAIDDDMTVNKTLEMIASNNPDSDIYFGKGGDRNKDNIPEFETCQKYNIKIIDGLGAKIDSSSRIVENVHTPAKILTANIR
jgi:cytidyltransferase-like protein